MPGAVRRVPRPAGPVPGPPVPDAATVVGRHPWDGTTLGPPESWDPAVRAAVEIVLTSPAPMALHLGEELLLLYNDAYAELIGDKHPWAVGQPATEVFAEVWRTPGVGEVVEQAYRTGEPLLEKEVPLPLGHDAGGLEPAVYTRACSPVRDSLGRIVGVLSVVAETSPATRQLQGLSDFAAALSGTLTLDDVARVALRYAITSFDADRVSFAVDEGAGGGGWRMVRRVRGELVDEADERLPPLWRRGPADWRPPAVVSARSGRASFTDDGQPLREIAVDRLAAVVLVTAFSQRELIEEASDAGVHGYVVKPFERHDLVPAIEVAIARFRAESTLVEQAESAEGRLEARKVIDRAKGILMDAHGMSEQDSYGFIQKTAMKDRRQMRDVAQDVIDGALVPAESA